MGFRDNLRRLSVKLQPSGRSRSTSRSSSPAIPTQGALKLPTTPNTPHSPATSSYGASSQPSTLQIPSGLATSHNTPNLHVTPSPPPPSVTKTLWDEAVEKLKPEDQNIFDLNAPEKLNTLEEVIKETKAKRDECKTKQWKYTTYVDSLLAQLDKFATIGDLVVKHSPSIVAIPWAGFRFLLQLRLNDTEIMGNVLLALEYIAHTLSRCAIYEYLYLTPLGQSQSALNLAASLPDLYAAILTYLCESKRFFTQKTPVRVLDSTWDPYISRFKPLMENIKNQEWTVESSARVAAEEYQRTRDEKYDLVQKEQMQKLQEILAAMQMLMIQKRIEENSQDTERQAILKWLSEVTIEEHHNFIKSKRHEGSGEWLLQRKELIDWKESKESSILWLHGIAGAGKTNLASAVIDKFQNTRQEADAVVYFYCRYDQEERRDPPSILRSLVKQLSTMEPGSKLPESVTKIYRARKDGGFKSGPLALEESKKLLIQLAADFRLTIITIDALDECNKSTRDELLDALKDILNLSQGLVKIFVTSRDDQDIILHLDGSPNVYIKSTDNSSDINRFIAEEIDSLISRRKILFGNVNSELRECIVSTLTKHADGMFLWVHLQIQGLIQQKTRPDLEKALVTMPAGIGGTFSDILRRINDQTESSKLRAHKALKLIFGAQRPLSSTELIQALSVESMAEGLGVIDGLSKVVILDECQNFVVIDEELDVFRFAHLSVRDFLKTQFSDPDTHTTIAEICLSSFFWNRKSSFISYAKEYWALHIRTAERYDSSPLFDFQKILFKPGPVFNEWLQKLRYPERFLWLENRITTPLEVACAFGLDSTYKYLLSTSTNLNSKTQPSHMLLLAACGGYGAVGRLLLGKDDFEVNCKDDYGSTPLDYAALYGYEAVVKLLLERDDVEVNCKDDTRSTPLHKAVSKGHEAVVKLLLERDDVEVNGKDDTGSTPLHRAVSYGHEAVVKLLLERDDVEVNCKDDYRSTPLYRAVSKGHEEVVKLLLERDDIEVNCKHGDDGTTPLDNAASEGHETVVKWLLERHDVEVNCRDEDGLTPLHNASSGGHEAVVKLLLERDDVEVNCKDNYRSTPLHSAAYSGQEAIVKLLLEKDNIEVNCRDDGGSTPLNDAASQGYEAVVKLLLEREDVEVNCKDSYKSTPLHNASLGGHEAVVKWLLERDDVEVNCKDNNRQTPLINAAICRRDKVVKLLLERKDLDMNYENSDGNTALAISTRKGYSDIEELLKDAAISRCENV